MSVDQFNPRHGPILVEGEASGPAGSYHVRLLLDTGATNTVISRSVLQHIGYDPDQSPRTTTMITGSGVETVPVVVLTRLTALGQHRFGLPEIAHALPATARVDGLLGLDFLRGGVLTIDFRAGQLAFA